MPITDIVLSGKIYQDDGGAVNGATVALLETGTSTQEASTTSDSNGAWSFTETSLDATYDIKITSGTSVRYILWSDEITTKGVDTASLKVRGVEGAAAPIYFFADQADDAGDGWRIQASASDTLAIGSDKDVAGTIIDYLTITNGANAAASTAALAGTVTVGTALNPASSDGAAMGTGSLMWSDLFLASGSVVNFNNGDVTLTHSSNTLTVGGGTLATAALTASTGVFSGILKTDDTTEATSTTDGSLQTDGGLSVAKDAVFGDDVFLLSDSAVLNLGAGNDATLTHDGTTGLTIAANPIIVDSGAQIELDSASGIITFEDGGTEVLRFTEGNSGDVTVKLVTNGKDLIFTDNGDATNMKILDAAAGINVPGEVQTTGIGYTDGDNAMTIADGGGVTFPVSIDITGSAGIILENDETITNSTNGYIALSGGLTLPNDGTIGSAGDADSIAISSAGVVTMNQIPVFSAGINVSGGTIAGTLATAAQGNITSLGTLTALTVDDVAINGKVVTMTGSSSDTAVFTAGTNGTLSIVTTDAAAAAANIQITADGTAELAGTTVTLDSGGDIELEATNDINIPTDKGLTFGDDGQKIESDGTDFTIASGAKLNLTPTSNVHIANGTGLVIGHTAAVNVGAGTTTTLQVLGTAFADSGISIGRFDSGGSGPSLRFVKSKHSSIVGSSGTIVSAADGGDILGDIVFVGDDGDDLRNIGAHIQARVDGTPRSDEMPAKLVFLTNAGGTSVTERMSIASDGGIFMNSLGSAGSGTALVIDGSDEIIPSSSSVAYKDNVRTIESDSSRVFDLTPRSFDWKRDGLSDFGLIAEEVHEVMPEMVIYNKDGNPEAVKYDRLSVLLLMELHKIKKDLEAA